MDGEIIKAVAQAAGIGGVALGVLLLLFREVIRKNLFPDLSREQGYKLIRLVVSLTFAIAVLGIGAWVWVQKPPGANRPASAAANADSEKSQPGTAASGSVSQTVHSGTGYQQTGSGQIIINNTDSAPPTGKKETPTPSNHP